MRNQINEIGGITVEAPRIEEHRQFPQMDNPEWRRPLLRSEALRRYWLHEAAPETLDMLERATAQIAIWRSINGDMVGALADLERDCRAAIAKATGAHPYQG